MKPSKLALALVFAIVILLVGRAYSLTPDERKIVVQMKDAITELRGKLQTAQDANDQALASLTLAALQTSELSLVAKVAQEHAMAMTAERDLLADENYVMRIKLEKLNQKYQRAQFIIALVSSVAVVLLVFQFSRALPPPYNLVAPLGAGAVTYIAIVSLL
jgi:hypothetical protein